MKLRLPIAVFASAALSGQVLLPVEQDFESEAACSATCGVDCVLIGDWTNALDDDVEWIIQAGGTPSNATGPSLDFLPGTASGQYAYVEATGACSPDARAHLLSPVLSPGAGAHMSFRYHQRGADMGTLSVDQQEPVRHLDGVLLGATETLSSPTADFSVLSPGMHVAIVGSLGNDGVYPVLNIVDPNTVQLDMGGGAVDEAPITFDAWHPDGDWTLDLFGPVSDDVDLWQHAACVPLQVSGAETRVRFAAVTGPGFASDMAIDAVSVEAPQPIDLAIQEVEVVAPGCGDTTTLVSVTLVNTGATELVDVPLLLRVDGGPAVQEVVPGTIGVCGVVEYTFGTQVELGTLGGHTISVEHAVVGDARADNDVATADVYAPPILDSYPISDDLEGLAAAAWRTGGDESSWAVGTPAKTVIAGAASGTQAWVTGGLGTETYNPLEDSFVEGPCYDFSSLTHPRVELSVWWDAEFSWDGAAVEASIDDGVTWDTVGAFGDPINWYSDDSILSLPGGDGWSGADATSNGSGGWVSAGHGLDGLAGESLVRLRVRFAADSTVQDDGFAFDDWRVVDDPPGIEALAILDALPADAAPAGVGRMEVLALELEARGADQTILSLPLSLGGVLDADVSAVELWLDDGDGVFDAATDLAFAANPQLPVDGVATFSTPTELFLPAYVPRRIFATVDLRASAAGSVLQAAVDPADVVASGPFLDAGPVLGPSRGVFQVGLVPLVDDFSGGSPHRTVDLGPGTFPESVGAGLPAPLGAPTSVAGTAGLVDSQGLIDLPTDRLRLAPPDAAALDYHLDLSAYAAGPADLSLRFSWEHGGGQLDDGDGVFLSLDGGATWDLTLFPLPSGPSTALEETLDLDAALQAAGLTFTDQAVLRFQAEGPAGEELLLDDVFVGTLPDLRVARGNTLTDGATDLLGDFTALVPTEVSWELHNDGHLDLSLGAPVLSGASNADVVLVSAPSVVPPGDVGLLTVEITAQSAGPLGFELALPADDHRLADGVFDLTLAGEGTVQPDLVLLFEDEPVFDGDVVDVGVHTAGLPLDTLLEVLNQGTGPLTFTGAAPMLFANAQNVGASVAVTPTDPLPAGEESHGILTLIPQADGAFSVDVIVQTDDPDSPVLTLTLEGVAVSPGLQLVRGGIIPPGGVEDAGAHRPGSTLTWAWSLNNTGTGDVTLLGAPDPVALANVSGPLLASVSSQPAVLIPTGASVGFVLELEVTGLGPFSVDLVVESNDAEHPLYVVTIVGEGVEPELVLEDANGSLDDGDVVDFGPLRVGDAVVWAGEVTNAGTGDLSLPGTPPLELSDLVAAAGLVLTQPAALVAPGGSEPFAVELTAQALGPFSGVLTLRSDDADEPVTSVQLVGTGVLPDLRVRRAGVPLADGATDDLGELRRARTSTLAWVLGNDGTGPLAFTGSPEPLAILNPLGAQVTISTPPPASLPAGDEAVLALDILPLEDAFSFDLVLPTDDPQTPTYTLHAEGVAVAPSLSVQRDGVPIPADGVDALGDLSLAPTTRTWTLTNTGTASLAWTEPPSLEVTGAAAVEVLHAPSAIPAGGEDELRLTVLPGADGDIAFDVLLATDDPDVPDYAFTVVASVVSPRLRLSRNGVELNDDATDPLGEFRVDRPTTWSWTLLNDGSADAALLMPDPVLLRSVDGLAIDDLIQPPAVLSRGTSAEFAVTARAGVPGDVGFELLVRRADGKEITLHASGTATIPVEPPDPEPEGCGCAVASPDASWPLFLLPLAVLRRRRPA